MPEQEEYMILRKDGTLVPREFGKDEGARDYASYDEAVDDLNAQSLEVEHRALEINWMIGRVAYLIKEKSSYGSHDIEELSKDLDKSPSTIYTDIKLYMTFTLEDIQRLRDEDIPLRRVNQLMKADAQNRELIEDAMTQMRINDDTLRTMIKNANDGVVMPEDPAGMRQYVEKCRDGWSKDDDDLDEEDDDEEEEEKIDASDPAAKFIENVNELCDGMSLNIDKVEMDITQLTNVIKGDIYANLDDDVKARVAGVLGGIRKQLSKILNTGYRLMQKLPGDTTKEADSNAAQG